MIIQRLGHAALLVEVGSTRILVDPGTYAVGDAFEQPNLDAIAITHQHPDHADPDRLPALLSLNPDAQLLAEAGAAEKLAGLGRQWAVLEPGIVTDLGSVQITGVGGQHAVIRSDLPRVGNVGIIVAADGQPTLFHPGDAYEEAPPSADILALPISAPWAKLSETVEFSRQVKAEVVLPIHDRALTEVGYPIYWRTIEQLGGAVRYERLDQTGRLTVP